MLDENETTPTQHKTKQNTREKIQSIENTYCFLLFLFFSLALSVIIIILHKRRKRQTRRRKEEKRCAYELYIHT